MPENNEIVGPQGIAIIGMSGRFPGAENVDEFWRNLVGEVDCIAHFTEAELEYTSATPEDLAQDRRFIRARGVVENAGLFDANFFGMYPKEAELVDPQHRLFLECAWEALESSGHAPESYHGLIGVYAGLSMNTYLLYNLCANRAFASNFAGSYQVGAYHTMLGNDKDFMPTRVSYKLNLRGPSMSVQSACSTSLVAICQACTSLMTYQCDMALAGGVSISFPQKRDYPYQEEGMVSADGTCRSFDAQACGTVFGHGVAVVLLKRVEDAIADGDPILAVIKGTAINNDGSEKIGYAAPSVTAQADVVAMAQAAAGFDPETVSYIEAHGTATPLGDPIEVAALTKAFRQGGATRNQYCAIGTGKTNIGHLDVAAGATGLIKTVLQLQNELVPRLLHFKSPNPKIDFENSPFFPVGEPKEWKRGATPRRAGVSAFGVGGTNAHVAIEEAPLLSAGSPSRKCQFLMLSAKTDSALERMSVRLAEWLEKHPVADLADVAFTLHRGRQRFARRQVICASDRAEAIERLRTRDSKYTFISQSPSQPPSIAFLFPGQGAQYVNMGRDLYESEPVFRSAIDKCAEILQTPLRLDIRSVLYPATTETEEATRWINETSVTQPSIFAVEYALARLWMSWGIEPALLIGHSVGEYVAAVLGGVYTLQEALRLLSSRAMLMQDLPSGSMLAVRLGASELESSLPEGVSVAAINSPHLTTLSGPTPILHSLKEEFDRREIQARLLPTSHAFHSAMMDPIVEPFATLAAETPSQPSNIPWISSCTGTWIGKDAGPEGTYWAKQLREPVRFAQAIETAIQHGITTFVEVGPGRALSQFVRQQPTKPAGLNLFTSLRTEGEGPGDHEAMLTSLGRFWLAGIEPNWNEFYSSEKRRRLSLPTYPFERQKYWVEPERSEPVTAKSGVHEVSTSPAAIAAQPIAVQESTRPAIRQVLEMQMQIMEQQLQMLRPRPPAERN
jgi:acyl transferase domain-containing protein